MVTLARFFQFGQMASELLFIGEGRGIDALQHGVLFVATPVGTSYTGQLEGLDTTCAGQMGTATEINKITLAVKGNDRFRQIFDKPHLVIFAKAAK